MSPGDRHRCTVQLKGDGAPYLAFELSSGERSAYSNSLFTLDLKPKVTVEAARRLCDQINAALQGVSTTVF